MKLGILLLVVSVLLFITGYVYKVDPSMIDLNHTCVFFGLLFFVCGAASLIGGE